MIVNKQIFKQRSGIFVSYSLRHIMVSLSNYQGLIVRVAKKNVLSFPTRRQKRAGVLTGIAMENINANDAVAIDGRTGKLRKAINSDVEPI